MLDPIETTFDARVLRNEMSHEKGYRHWTAKKRTAPSFFIAGAQKAGTTSLYQFLVDNKYINQTSQKELYFFNNQENYEQGEKWYRSHFPLSSSLPTCDATANYFESKDAPERIRIHYPNAKIIILLRNPVDRAFSHYKMAAKFGFEKLSFEEALQREDERLAYEQEFLAENHPYIYQRLGYRTKGLYSEQIKHWMSSFPNEQIKVVVSEELFSHPKEGCGELLEFLGFETDFTIPLKQANAGLGEEMSPKIRKELNTFYAPFNRELSKILNKTLNW